MKFTIKDFFSKCDQIRRKLRMWSHLLKKSLMENFDFCVLQCKPTMYSTHGIYLWQLAQTNLECCTFS